MVFASPSRKINLTFIASTTDEYSPVSSDLVPCGNEESSSLNDAHSRQLLVAERHIRSCFASSNSTVSSPMAPVGAACYGCWLAVRVLVNVFDSARLPAGIQTSAVIFAAISPSFFSVARLTFPVGDLE